MPGTVLTAGQILTHLNFTILWTWCMIVFLCVFFIYTKDQIPILAAVAYTQYDHSCKLPASIEWKVSRLVSLDFTPSSPKPPRLTEVRKQGPPNFAFTYMWQKNNSFFSKLLVRPTLQEDVLRLVCGFACLRHSSVNTKPGICIKMVSGAWNSTS